MSIYAWTVTAENVRDSYPRSRGGAITETSEGLSLPVLRVWVEEGSAMLNAALEARGYSDLTTQLQANAIAMGAAAVRNYVVARMLLSSNRAEESTLYRQAWEDALKQFRTMPEYLGASQPATAQVSSNIDPTSPSRNAWGRDFKGW